MLARDPFRIAVFWSNVIPISRNACWLWNGTRHGDGYGHFKVDGHTEKAHRVAYELTFGEIPAGMLVCHSCDNPPCINPVHLFLGTDADNVHDRVQKGRSAGKVSLAQAAEIRSLYASGQMTQAAVGRRFGIGQDSVSRIVNMKNRPTTSASPQQRERVI